MDNPDAGLTRGVRRSLPRLAHLGQEVRARFALLAQEFVSAVAVVTDSRGAHHDVRGLCEPGERLGEQARAHPPALHNAPLLLRRPTALGDALPGEVDDCVDPSQARGVEGARGGAPAYRIFCRRPRWAQTGARVAATLELRDQSRADEPRGPADQHVHRILRTPSPTLSCMVTPKKRWWYEFC